MRKYFSILLALLPACSGLEQSEKEKIRRRNCSAELIYRSHNDFFFAIQSPTHTPRPLYPWETETNLPRITKEFFRCKGTLLNDQADCEGSRHSLPLLYGKENVYPILLDLLNYLQKKTHKRVIITSAHRCPRHNTYVDPAKENRTSKYQIGAAADFYIQGMEDRPLEIVGLLMQYYHENPLYQNQKEYLTFQRYDKPDTGVSTPPWFNQEIYIKLHQKHEGRNADNRHPHPYLSLQVRYDKLKHERVVYDWEKAYKGYTQE